MPKKREVVTLSLAPVHLKALEAIALEHGCKWGERPNVSELLRRIAAGELVVSHDPVAMVHQVVGLCDRIKADALSLISH